MLTIRREQFEKLTHYALAEFVKRMVAHVRKVWPEKVADMNDEKIKKAIENYIEYTRNYHIVREVDVAQFINLAYAFDWDFHIGPVDKWALQILNNNQLVGREKIDQLYTQAEQWLSASDGK